MGNCNLQLNCGLVVASFEYIKAVGRSSLSWQSVAVARNGMVPFDGRNIVFVFVNHLTLTQQRCPAILDPNPVAYRYIS